MADSRRSEKPNKLVDDPIEARLLLDMQSERGLIEHGAQSPRKSVNFLTSAAVPIECLREMSWRCKGSSPIVLAALAVAAVTTAASVADPHAHQETLNSKTNVNSGQTARKSVPHITAEVCVMPLITVGAMQHHALQSIIIVQTSSFDICWR